MAAAASIPTLIADLFWPSHPTTQIAILLLVGLAILTAALVHAPLIVRLIRIGQLQRSVQACFDDESSNAIQRQGVANAFEKSPLAYHWSDFVRRWQNAIAAGPIQDASLPELSRAPVRLTDVLEEHPLIPAGARRSLLPALPAIFLSAGLLGAFAGLVLALPGIGLSLDPPSFDPAARGRQIEALMNHLSMALRIGLWGLLLSLVAAISGRLIEGRADILAETLDSWVQLAYGAISSGELTARTAHEQRMSLARLRDEVNELGRQLAGRPRPPIRSTAVVPGAAPASNVDSEAALRAVESLGASLSHELSQQLERTLAEQLAGSLERSENLSAEQRRHLDSEFDELRGTLAGLASRIQEVSEALASPLPAPPASAPLPASEADTVPYIDAPTPDSIYPQGAEGAARSGEAAHAENVGRGLSGLLRATHHSGPSSDLPDPDFDSAQTVMLESSSFATSQADAEPAEADDAPGTADPEEDDGEPPRRRGLFNRRK